MEIPRRLIGNNRLTIPIVMLDEFEKGQVFKIDIIDGVVKLTAVKADNGEFKLKNDYGVVNLLEGNRFVFSTEMQRCLKLHYQQRMTITYNGGETIFISPDKCKCSFCKKEINRLEDKHILAIEKTKVRKAVCSECFEQLEKKL